MIKQKSVKRIATKNKICNLFFFTGNYVIYIYTYKNHRSHFFLRKIMSLNVLNKA